MAAHGVEGVDELAAGGDVAGAAARPGAGTERDAVEAAEHELSLIHI